MKTAITALLIIIILTGIVFGLQPTLVFRAASDTNTVEVYAHSRIYTLVMNAAGDLQGYGRCAIINQSRYWACSGWYDLRYSKNEGMAISDYAATGLKNLIKMGEGDLAYRIAQDAFDKLQKESWGTSHKLIYPLVIKSSRNRE